jgi:hypothetical protein
MRILTCLFIVSVLFGYKSFAKNYSNEQYIGIVRVQDTLPPLHTIPSGEIASVGTSRENASVIVTLKNGNVLSYRRADWDYENYYPSTDKAIKEAIESLTITFTKIEQEASFPGGDEAWEKYRQEFCLQHQKEIRKHGSDEITVQFIVHIQGQVSDVRVIRGGDNEKMANLAISCIQNGPLWIAGVQNGRKMPSYKLQVVKLER